MRLLSYKFTEYAEKVYFPDVEKKMKKSSYANFKWVYKKYIRPYFVNVRLKDITTAKVQACCDDLVKKGLSNKTIRAGFLCVFNTIINHAVRHGEMSAMLIRVTLPKENNSKEKTKIMNEADLETLEKYLKQPLVPGEKYRAIIFAILALYQGLRIGEICGLKWEDIDFKNKTISIKRTVQRICDPDTNKSAVYIGAPKTQTSNRIIPMLNITEEKLKWAKEYHINACKSAYIPIDNVDNHFVLGGINPTEPRTLRRVWEVWLKLAGIDYINPHVLRHTFCTRAINKGCPTNAVSKILGHSNESITLNVYNHLTTSKMNEAISILNS